jgi:endonuclease YncB( thermonuclease family)
MLFETVKGEVLKIVDVNVFDMKVTHIGLASTSKFKEIERIYIAEIENPELENLVKARKINDIEKKLVGKKVRCSVISRDGFGRLTARVKVI